MNDNLVTLSLISRLVRHRWQVLVLLALLGVLLGAGASLVLSPGYESSSKVLFRGERNEEQMLGETQVATSLVVLDRAAIGLGWGETGADLKGRVTAAVTNGNVIELRGTASTPERAQQLTERATTEYISFSTQIANDTVSSAADAAQRSREVLQQRIDDANQKITQLQAATTTSEESVTELNNLRTVVADSNRELEDIENQSESEQLSESLTQMGMGIIEPAVRPTSAASPTFVELVVGGSAALVALGLLGHLIALRSDRRLRGTQEIEAALGAPVFGTVEVEHACPTGNLSRSWLGRLLHDDRQWATDAAPAPADGPQHAFLYRRVLARLPHGEPPARLLVLVPEGDEVAQRATAQLLLVVGTEQEPALVITDSDPLADIVRAAAENMGTGPRPILITSSDPLHDADRPVVRLVTVSVARPTVPDVAQQSATLLVLTAGTRTGWELVALAGASADAGQPVAGALVAVPVQAAGSPGPADAAVSSHATSSDSPGTDDNMMADST